jgi:hypothetical protein
MASLLRARTQREICGLYRRIARQQLCERLDCATVSRGHVTSVFPQVTSHTPHRARCYATLGKHPFQTRLRCQATVRTRCVFCWSDGEFIRETGIPKKAYLCGGGVEYLHRDPASRRRRRKGKSQIWDSKIWSRVPRDSDPRKTALARASSIYKKQTCLLVRGGAKQKTRP